MYPVKLASQLWFIIQEWWVHHFFPFISDEKGEDNTLIWWEDKRTINFLANLFLILTLTHKETEQQLTPVATSKLDAGVLQMYGFGEKEKKKKLYRKSLSVLLRRIRAVLTGWGRQSRYPNQNSNKKSIVWTNGKNDQALIA